MLAINNGTASVIDAATGETVDTVDLRGVPELAAISNNRKYIAAVLRYIFSDIYVYKKEQEGWKMISLGRSQMCPQKIAWKESSDSRYPPEELAVRTADAEKTYLPDGK